MKKIIAIIWRAWAGKDLAGDYVSKKLWIPNYSISEWLRISARKRWLEESRENLIKLGKEFVEKYGDEYLAKIIVESTSSDSIIITGMRQLWQLQYCRENHNTTFIWVSTDSKTRYKRLIENKKFSWSYENFLWVEKLDEWKIQNVWECLKLCETIIENNGSIEEFEDKLWKIFS
jgi:dephospho-CoA kinase